MGAIIYGLADPRTGALRYIGKTKSSIHRRKMAHINDVRRGRVYIPRHKWISELLLLGLEPEVFEIEHTQDWREAEQFWIAYFKFVGCELLNATAGGDGICSYRHTPEARARQSAAARARYQRPGERERSGEAVRLAYSRPEARQNLRDGRKTVPRESIQVCIDALVRKARSPEGRAATSARTKGRLLSPETKAKISVANTGKTWTRERREKFRQFRLGRKHSAETKAKMSFSQIARRSKA